VTDAGLPDASGNRQNDRIGPGAVVLVVGPSGAGKDALIAGARAVLAGDHRFIFADRHISRPAHAAEVHISLSDAAFADAAGRREYALFWNAHGLNYGIPVTIDDHIRSGRTVVFNASRAIVPEARRRYAQPRIALIDCPAEIRAARIALRAREEPPQLRQRLTRTVEGFDEAWVDVRIDNSCALQVGVERFVAALRKIGAPAPQPPANPSLSP
jgi:phosphonate metabolism protein PhnN/1,5-bisphosphokinase (PRPP-forming)